MKLKHEINTKSYHLLIPIMFCKKKDENDPHNIFFNLSAPPPPHKKKPARDKFWTIYTHLSELAVYLTINALQIW